MTRITPSDQVLLLLRAQLQEISRARTQKPDKPNRQRPIRQSPLERMQALEQFDDWTDESKQKALVRSILAEELSPALANEPRFIAICNDVHRVLTEDAEGQALLNAALRQLLAP